MYLPGIPVHVIQRGNNRQQTFFEYGDFLYYLGALAESLERYSASLHAYTLMSNHVHLLITPEHEDSVPRIMQHVGRRYVLYINRKYSRSGTLWEGRYKCSLVDADNYLLMCYRYIEMNPVEAGMVKNPADYEWSSHRCNAVGKSSPLVTPHRIYLALGATRADRLRRYRELFKQAHRPADREAIEQCLDANYPLGNAVFCRGLSARLEREIGHARKGRPYKCSGAV